MGTGLPPWFLQSKRRPDALSVAPDKQYASMSQHLGSRQKRGQLVRGNFGAIEEPQQSRQHGCDFQPMLLQALEADLFEEFHSCTDRLASQISRDLGEKVDAMRQETAGSLQLLKADLKSLGDVVRVLAATSHTASRESTGQMQACQLSSQRCRQDPWQCRIRSVRCIPKVWMRSDGLRL